MQPRSVIDIRSRVESGYWEPCSCRRCGDRGNGCSHSRSGSSGRGAGVGSGGRLHRARLTDDGGQRHDAAQHGGAAEALRLKGSQVQDVADARGCVQRAQSADVRKICTATASPQVNGNVVGIVVSKSGACDKVDDNFALDLDDDYVGETAWAPHSGDTSGESFESSDQGVCGASASHCILPARGDSVHISGRDVQAHGRWWSVVNRQEPLTTSPGS